MVEELPSETSLDDVFHALADGTRRAMLLRLTEGPGTVGELAAPHAMSLAAASKHVKVLERAGLLRREIVGREHRCHLAADALEDGRAWLRRVEGFWNARLDALEAALEEDGRGRPGGSRRRGLPHQRRRADVDATARGRRGGIREQDDPQGTRELVERRLDPPREEERR